MKDYQKLKQIFKRLSHLQYLQRVLMWDEAVMMPEGAGPSRAQALATLTRTMHKMLISKKTKAFLASAKNEVNLSSWNQSNLYWMEKIYHRAACISPKLTEEATKASMACEQAWRRLRPQNNWTDFLPYLKQSFNLMKEIAHRRAEALHIDPYDTLIDEYAPGFNQKSLDSIFSTLKNTLPVLIQKIMAKQQSDKIQEPKGPFPVEKQKLLGLTVMKALGFDFQQGRLDISHHPFCSGGPTDVRVTTRYSQDEFIRSLYAICHETGHALYEQGLPRKWINQPVGHVDSMAMHESQSLLIEMEVCRSFAFHEFLAPHIRAQFGEQPAFTVENLYKLVTRVKPGFIRVDADEVTYPLHIILRYEIEKGLFKNEITIQDLPAYWDDSMKKYLGLSTQGNDQYGVMQDVHWAGGAFGYFPAYSLGRLIAAQLFATYKTAHPPNDNFKKGNFGLLRNWLKENVYGYASSLSTNDLLLKVTDKNLDTTYFIKHIEDRYLKN